jgi:hypothetical protein
MKKMVIVALVIASTALFACGGKKKDGTMTKPTDKGSATMPAGSGDGSAAPAGDGSAAPAGG